MNNVTDTVRSSPAAGLTQGKTRREKATEGHLQECGERRCRLGLQSRDAGGGRGSDPGCTLKVEPTRFARDLMWRERERKREAWRTTATFPGTTALCVPTCASPTGNASSSRRGQCPSALATLHKVRPTDACRESHEASPNSFSVPSFCLQGLWGRDGSSCPSCSLSLHRYPYPSTFGMYTQETMDLNNEIRQQICP